MADFLVHNNIVISLSLMVFGLYIWEVLAYAWHPFEALSLALICWQVYTLDRVHVHPEDQKHADQDLDIARFARRHARRIYVLLGASLLLQLWLAVFFFPRIFWVYLVSGLLSVFYMMDLPLVRRRVKSLPYVKAFYVALVYWLTPLLYVREWSLAGGGILLLSGHFFFGMINNNIFDLKDRELDRRAGILTFANTFSYRTNLVVSQILLLLLAVGLLVLNPEALSRALALSLMVFASLIFPLYKKLSVRYLFLVLDAVMALPWVLLMIF